MAPATAIIGETVSVGVLAYDGDGFPLYQAEITLTANGRQILEKVTCTTTGTVTLVANARHVSAEGQILCREKTLKDVAEERVDADLHEMTKPWEDCREVPGWYDENLTGAQLEKRARQLRKRLRGKRVEVVGYIDDVEAVWGLMDLILVESDQSNTLDSFRFDVRRRKLRRTLEKMGKGEHVIVKGRYTGNLSGEPCVGTFGVTRFLTATGIERVTDYRHRKIREHMNEQQLD